MKDDLGLIICEELMNEIDPETIGGIATFTARKRVLKKRIADLKSRGADTTDLQGKLTKMKIVQTLKYSGRGDIGGPMGAGARQIARKMDTIVKGSERKVDAAKKERDKKQADIT